MFLCSKVSFFNRESWEILHDSYQFVVTSVVSGKVEISKLKSRKKWRGSRSTLKQNEERHLEKDGKTQTGCLCSGTKLTALLHIFSKKQYFSYLHNDGQPQLIP